MALERLIKLEGEKFLPEFSRWLSSRDEQDIYAPVNELLAARGLGHPQVKAFFQGWLIDVRNLKQQYSKEFFMEENSYKIECDEEGVSTLLRRGRLMEL